MPINKCFIKTIELYKSFKNFTEFFFFNPQWKFKRPLLNFKEGSFYEILMSYKKEEIHVRALLYVKFKNLNLFH